MTTITDLKLIERVLRQMRLRASDGYFWTHGAKLRAGNLLISPDRWAEIDPHDLPTVQSPGDTAYCIKGRWFARVRASRCKSLTGILRHILAGSACDNALILPSNDALKGITLEGWMRKSERDRLCGNRRCQRLFDRLGIRPGSACGIECHLPKDAASVIELARWCWASHGRNAYVLLPALRTKIVICHEHDLHVCSLDHAFIQSVIEAVRAHPSLRLAPFELQQCC